MANDYDPKAKNVMLDALGAVATRIALHTGDPGAADTAANEVSGGGYARAAVAWNAATGGAMDNSGGDIDIPVPGGITVSWISIWNTAGTSRYLKKDVTDEAFGAAGIYRVTDADLDLNDA